MPGNLLRSSFGKPSVVATAPTPLLTLYVHRSGLRPCKITVQETVCLKFGFDKNSPNEPVVEWLRRRSYTAKIRGSIPRGLITFDAPIQCVHGRPDSCLHVALPVVSSVAVFHAIPYT